MVTLAGMFMVVSFVQFSNVPSLEIGEFTFDNCKSLKNLKLNSKLKDDFLMEIYPDLMTCPYMQVKWENNQYVYPAGLEFVKTE